MTNRVKSKHPFSPITDESRFDQALDYIAAHSSKLAEAVLGRTLVIDTLTVFAQSEEEYTFVATQIRNFGPVSPFTHGATLYISSDFSVQNFHIKILGVRRPDPTRPEVGYADYPVRDYDAILRAGYPEICEIISGRKQRLLEIRRPDFDVLGYIVAEETHNDR